MFFFTFGFLLTHFVCSGVHTQTISLEQRVFMALVGGDVQVRFKLVQAANDSGGLLKCFKQKDEIHSTNLQPTTGPVALFHRVELPDLKITDSGEYHCQYKHTKAFWVLLVREHDHGPGLQDYRGVLAAGVLTFLLLTFSLIGSVYVFKGNWENVTESSVNEEPGGHDKREGEEEGQREGEEEADDGDTIAEASDSFYASLEPHRGSIYDVLDHSAPNIVTGQRKAKSMSKESEKPMEPIPHNQDDGVFEAVYENF